MGSRVKWIHNCCDLVELSWLQKKSYLVPARFNRVSSKVKSKADLMMKIKQVRMLLNGRYRDGSKASFASDFKITRYAVVLLAAISISNFEYHTEKIQNGTFISYYNLYKVAKFLGIENHVNLAKLSKDCHEIISQHHFVKTGFKSMRNEALRILSKKISEIDTSVINTVMT